MAGTPDVHWRILKEVAAALVELDIVADQVFIQAIGDRLVGWRDGSGVTDIVKFPAIVLAAEGLTEAAGPFQDSEGKSWWYPVAVGMSDKNAPTNHGKLQEYLSWREKVRERFTGGLAAVPEVQDVEVDFGFIIDPSVRQVYQHVASGLLLRFATYEPRG